MKKNKILHRSLYLLLIAAIQYVVRFFVIKPYYNLIGVSLQMPEWLFALLVLSTLCIAIGGFFIADYYNKRQLSPVPRNSMEKADSRYTAFMVFSFIGCGLGLFIGWKIQFFNLGILFIIYATVLYFYALRYRLLAFWGNFVIALMVVVLILNVWLFEFFATRNNLEALNILASQRQILSAINTAIFSYSIFYFVLIFAQQIVKDIVISPRAASGSRIFPIRYGLKTTKVILLVTLILLLIPSVLFFIAPFVLSKDYSYSFIAGIFVIICEFILIFKVLRSSIVDDFKSSEYLFDILIILGIVALLFQ
ncbi:hypothetical protein LJC16_02550 [Bacteroidales bacterium OttesenSCG-928-C19]|nr:hypothetical protein [Bacteroidales bacterium OttesenSCG-928-C19]